MSEVIPFLQLLYPAGPWALVSFPQAGGSPTCATFASGQETEAAEWVARQNTADNNVYYHINPMRSGEARRAKKEDISHVAFLQVDIDPDAGADLVEDRERIRKRLTENLPESVPAPTFVVDSGNGYQALWRLAVPVALGPGSAAPEEIERYTRWLEIEFRADSCHNVDRILRFPGTTNWPTKTKLAKGRVPVPAKLLLAEPSRGYELSAFRQAAPIATAITDKPKGGVPAGIKQILSLAELPTAVKPRALVVIVQGNDPDDPFATRSEAVWYVCCELARADCDAGTIAGVILSRAFAISAHVYDQPRPEKYARRQAERARAEIADTFVTNKDGIPSPQSQHNIRLALAKLNIEVSYDLFANRLRLAGLAGHGPLLDDAAVDRLWLLTDERFGFKPSRDFYLRVVEDQARQNSYHPVCDYLDSLKWDRTPRVDRWLATYGGAEETELVRAVGALVLIAAVRRVRQPGCKFDEMLVLESPQGQYKSSALAALAVRPEWFSDDLPLNGDTKRQIEALAGRWIVEAGELKGMRKGEVEAMKSFLSRQADIARLAYGRLSAEFPRQCVIVGTTNSEHYLKDSTGNRRFWPVKVGTFDLESLRRDRDQLWAEAAQREAGGESIRLSAVLYAAAAEQQESRRVEDPFVQMLMRGLGDLKGKLFALDAWTLVGVPANQRTQDQNARMGAAMRELGWERTKRRFGANPEWCYVRGEEHERNVRIIVTATSDGGRAMLESATPASDPEIPF